MERAAQSILATSPAQARRNPAPPWTGALRFVRSALTGAAATLVDLAVLGLAVGWLHVAAKAANVPALLAGALVQFLGCRHFAFRAGSGPIGRQASLFAFTELVALGLNAGLFQLVATFIPQGAPSAVLARAITTNAVYLGWSYPMWRRVFTSPESVLK